DSKIVERFLKAEFSPQQKEIFQFIINDREKGHVRPLVVRSSTLNEDAERASFAGIYKSVPLPNCHADPEVRLNQCESAVKLVYASMFSDAAKSYRRDKEIPEGGEQMAVLV
ncbi:MAG TPA: PEP/pyruvate-binding domain-containing protein, partial [Candidatus Micrarchaeota archaeon]|nr:PEP/pyruvate-binding domain-containing protein [Candidatus Micrarchaeota archaeon]